MNIINAVFLFDLMTIFGEVSGCHNDDLACQYILFISISISSFWFEIIILLSIVSLMITRYQNLLIYRRIPSINSVVYRLSVRFDYMSSTDVKQILVRSISYSSDNLVVERYQDLFGILLLTKVEATSGSNYNFDC